MKRKPIPRKSKKRLEQERRGERSAFVRRTAIKRGVAVKKANPERQKKVAKRGAAKHRAYMASEARQLVDARAGGRCEFTYPAFYVLTGHEDVRCEETEGLEHHHDSYHNYGGGEVPEQMRVLCKAHHKYAESLKLAGNRRSRQAHLARIGA